MALLVAWRTGRWRSLVLSLLRWRVAPRWYVIALAGPPAVVLGAIGVHLVLGGRGLTFNDPAQWYLALVAFAYVLVLGGPLGEELGWRGFALPRLLERYGPAGAALLLGVAWAGWHLPLAFLPGTPQAEVPFPVFAVLTVALSVVCAQVWLSTGSLLVAILLHAASNTAAGILPLLPRDTGGSLAPFLALTATVLAIAAGIVIRWWRTSSARPPGAASRRPR